MEIDKIIYLSGTASRSLWDWAAAMKFHLKPYFVHDAEMLRRDALEKGPLTSSDIERQNKIKMSAFYEVYVITPEDQELHIVADAVDAAHRRKKNCIFLPLKSIQGPSFHIIMPPEQIASVNAIEDLISNIGGRVFTQPKDLINFLLCEANA